jgi:hypothetical protein
MTTDNHMLSAMTTYQPRRYNMSAASDYLEKKLLDHTLRNTAFSQPAGLFLALFTGVTGLETNAPTLEVTTNGTNGYIRKAIAFDAATLGAGSTSNTSTVTFDPCLLVNWGTITHIAVMDAVSSGNVLFFGAVTTQKTIEVGDTFQVSATNVSIALA